MNEDTDWGRAIDLRVGRLGKSPELGIEDLEYYFIVHSLMGTCCPFYRDDLLGPR